MYRRIGAKSLEKQDRADGMRLDELVNQVQDGTLAMPELGNPQFRRVRPLVESPGTLETVRRTRLPAIRRFDRPVGRRIIQHD